MIILGLGNIEKRYEKTRHNIGFMIVDTLLQQYSYIKEKNKLVEYYICNICNVRVVVAKPQTYMNNSGDAVQFLQTKYKDDLLIVNDEYNFDFGRIQVKQCKSDGGHNGVASVIEVMNGALFYQMRFGIAKNFGAGEMIEYVLSDFSKEEQDKLPDLLNYSVRAIEFFICNRDNKSKAISYINSGQIDNKMLDCESIDCN